MTKTVAQLTDEERAKQFPIILKNHNPDWKIWYEEEKLILLSNVTNIAAIHHCGSTSVPDLIAKPTVDILIEVKRDTDLEKLKNEIISLGYDFMRFGREPCMTFVKGYTINGFAEKVYHIHVYYKADYQEELLFRDYLINHRETAKEYGNLKTSLKDEFEHNRDGYTQAKSEFIKRITNIAKSELS